MGDHHRMWWSNLILSFQEMLTSWAHAIPGPDCCFEPDISKNFHDIKVLCTLGWWSYRHKERMQISQSIGWVDKLKEWRVQQERGKCISLPWDETLAVGKYNEFNIPIHHILQGWIDHDLKGKILLRSIPTNTVHSTENTIITQTTSLLARGTSKS